MALVKSELYLALKAAGVGHELASAAAAVEEPGTSGSPLNRLAALETLGAPKFLLQRVEASLQTMKMMLAVGFGLTVLILIAVAPQ